MENNSKSGSAPQGKNFDINESTAKCPFLSGTTKHTSGGGVKNRDWWPNELKFHTIKPNGRRF